MPSSATVARHAATTQADPAHALRDLFLLDPSIVHLNHGSFGACPKPVFEAYQGYQRELERSPTEVLGRLNQRLPEVRAALGAFVGADADDLVLALNATTALNAITRSFPLEPGDVVLGTNHVYGAMANAWTYACQQRGARYETVRIPLPMPPREELAERIWAAVGPRTRVLFLSHITSPTALILPVAELVARAREAGVGTVLDGAHAVGQIDLDLDALGADFYVASCHKWLMAPKGTGFLYARREHHASLAPLVVGWGWGDDPGPRTRLVTEHEHQGTRDPAGYLAVGDAVTFQREHEWPSVRARCHRRLLAVRARLSELTGETSITPEADGWFAQMASLPLPPCDLPWLSRELRQRYGVVVPILSFEGRGLIRISMQGYVTEEDLDRCLEGLAALLPEAVAREG
jgi:isopenicillin-N epimerase